jgi:hypothetical protein
MRRLLWALALVITFFAGWAASRTGVQEVDQLRDTVSRLRQQVNTLEARLRARDELATVRPIGAITGAPSADSRAGGGSAGRFLTGAVTEERMVAESVPGRAGAAVPPQADRTSSRPGSRGTAVGASSVEAALDRF